MYEGLDVLRLTGPEFADAARYSSADLNPQTQPAYDWVWRTAPTLPTTAAEREALPKLTVSPSTVAGGQHEGHPRLRAPAGTFQAGETVDLWWMDELTVLATVKAAPDGSLRTTEVYAGHALDARQLRHRRARRPFCARDRARAPSRCRQLAVVGGRNARGRSSSRSRAAPSPSPRRSGSWCRSSDGARAVPEPALPQAALPPGTEPG